MQIFKWLLKKRYHQNIKKCKLPWQDFFEVAFHLIHVYHTGPSHVDVIASDIVNIIFAENYLCLWSCKATIRAQAFSYWSYNCEVQL